MVEAGFHYDIGEFKCMVFSDGTLVNQDDEGEEVFDLNCLYINTGDLKSLSIPDAETDFSLRPGI